MKRYVWVLSLAACGGHRGPVGPAAPPAPRLVPTVAEQSWYRSTADCAQGPFTLDIPVGNAKYGDAVELALRTPRRIAIHATITAGDQPLAEIDDTFDASGRVGGSPDNGRCVADARERLAAQRARRAGTQGTPTTAGSGSVITPSPGALAPPPPASVAAALEVVAPPSAVGETSVIDLKIPSGVTSLHVTWWSIEPNDLDGVAFGLSHVVWKPDVGEQAYDAYLAEQEAKRVAEEQRQAQLRIEAQARAQAEAEARARRSAELVAHQDEEAAEARARIHVHVETADERRLRLEAEARAQRAAEKLEADQRAAEERRRRREAEEAERYRLKVEADQRAAAERARFCAAHVEDRGCWGPGGMSMKLRMDAHIEARTAYCAQHHEDARCWTDDDRMRIHAAEQARVEATFVAPSKPNGPPPAALAETIPPRLSVNATWRPGYWMWLDSTWVWLAGMWRVPEQDIVAEQTTTAPSAPPPLQVETPAPQPVASTVWVAGFWQWDGARWVWIAGSWQLRPSAAVTWRAATWQPRGSVHVLVPGGWIHIGGSR